MRSARRRALGHTRLRVTEVGIGTSPLASLPNLYGYDVEYDRAVETVAAVLRSPFRHLDTSNGYGDDGAGELRVGAAIRRCGGLPEDMLLATKVDPAPGSSDFSGARVRESYQESLSRLGVARVPLLHLHDPERIGVEAALARGGPVEALLQLKQEGAVDAIGVAGGDLDVMMPLVDTGHFDVVLTHSRFTLLDQTAAPLLDLANEMGLGVINAAPYGGGVLVRGSTPVLKHGYRERPDMVHSLERLRQICNQANVPLPAAALQFSVRDARIDSTLVGVSAPTRLAQTLEWLNWDIPVELWAQIDALEAHNHSRPAVG